MGLNKDRISLIMFEFQTMMAVQIEFSGKGVFFVIWRKNLSSSSFRILNYSSYFLVECTVSE